MEIFSMSFFSRFFKSDPLPEAEAPSEAFATPLDAIKHLVAAHRDFEGSWVTLDAEAGGKAETIQVAAESINLLLEETDLATILENLGLTALASIARKAGDHADDPTLWTLPDASPDEIVVVVDALFARHFGLGPEYCLRGCVEQ
jgi:hypothetical protein